MHKIILASAVALATTLSVGVGTASADVTVRLGAPHRTIVQERHVGPPRHHYRHHARHCFKKRVVSFHHGRRVVKIREICR